MAMRVWFEDANGNERVIKNTANTWAEVHKAITDFINSCNINKHTAAKQIYGDQYDPSKVNEFKWYYTRVWKQEDGRTKIDVGSHSEFFLWEGTYE